MQVIVLSIEVAKLARTNRLGAFLQIPVPMSARYPNHPVSGEFLCLIMRQLEAEEFGQDGEYLKPATRLLGWRADPNNGQQTCLPEIGGCTFPGVKFLIKQMWSARKGLLHVAKRVIANSTGWCGSFTYCMIP